MVKHHRREEKDHRQEDEHEDRDRVREKERDIVSRKQHDDESKDGVKSDIQERLKKTPEEASDVLFSISQFLVEMESARKVLVPIAVGTEPMEAVIVIDVLRRAGAHVTVASVGNQLTVDTLHGVTIVADTLISACADTVFDLISIPGGTLGVAHLRENMQLMHMLKKHAKESRIYGATGPAPAALLGQWFLLCNLKATCMPSYMGMLSSYANPVDSRVQLDGKAVTSQGLGTTMEYALALVEQLFGREKALRVSRLLLVTRFMQNDKFIAKEMNQLQWTCGFQPKVLLAIADGSEEMEVVMINAVLQRAKVRVVVASVGDNREIMASGKVRLVAEMLLSDAAKLSYDLIVLPGGLGGAQAFAKSEALVNLLKKQSERGRYYGAISTSSNLVHRLLKGGKATTFRAAKNKVVVDGKLITSRGLGRSLVFSLAIVEKLLGRDKALETAKLMLAV